MKGAGTNLYRPADSGVSAPFHLHLVEGGAKPLGELLRIVVRPEMHEEEARLLAEHVVVQGRDLDAVLAKRAEHRVHLVGREHEIARDGRLAAPGRLEIDGDRGAHRLRHLYAVIPDRLGAHHAHLIDAAIDLALAAEGLVERRDIEINALASGR